MAVIYKIEHIETKKKYIGKAINAERRWREHLNNVKKGKQHPLYNAIRKHGQNAFNFKILETVSEQELNQREIELIQEYNTMYPTGYNLAEGGTGGNTKKGMTEEQKVVYKTTQSENAKQRIKLGIGITAKSKKGVHITEICPEIAEKWKINYSKGQKQKSKRRLEGNFTQSELEGYKKLSELRKGGNNPRAAKIICIQTGRIFNSMSEAMQYYNLKSRTSIQTTIKTNKPSNAEAIKGLTFKYCKSN